MTHAPRRPARLGALLPRDAARRVALGWALAVFVLLALAGGRAGVPAAEGRFVEAAARHGGWWTALPLRPLGALGAVPAAFDAERGAAPLPLAAAGAGHALVGGRLGFGHLFGYRLASLLLAALLAYVLSRFGADLAGTTGAFLAPALFFLVPAQLDAALHAGTGVPAAGLWLGVLLAHLRGLRSRDRRERVRRAAVAGLLFGAAVATRRDAWALLPLLTVHYLVVRARRGLRARGSEGLPATRHPADRTAWRSLRAGLPSSLPAMLLLGPLVFAAFTPWSWHDPLRRILPAAWAILPADPFVYLGRVVASVRPPWHAPLLAAVLLPPAVVGFALLAGLLHAARRLLLGWRGEAAASFSDELLLLMGALAPLALAATGVAPAEAGLGPVLPAMAVLSVLAARAIATAARAAWPAGAARLAVAASLLVLYPAARATAWSFPLGGAAWNEWIGGAPGAASLGLPRGQSGAGAALLAEVSARAAAGQRVWWPSLSPVALDALRRDGRLRSDLRIAPSAAESDLAIVEHDEARRDLEYQVWTAYGSARPVEIASLDEVPLASVYARPGAWR